MDADSLPLLVLTAAGHSPRTVQHDVEPLKGDVQVSWEHHAAASDGARKGIDQGS